MNDAIRSTLDESVQRLAAEKASGASLIQNFGIRRLHGYRTISLASEFAATIIIAKNGTGKTTLLAVMDAFLKQQYSRLRNLEFTEIFCLVKGYGELVLTQDSLLKFLEIPNQGEILRLASRTGLPVETLFEFLLTDYKRLLADFYGEGDGNAAVSKLMQSYQYDYNRAIDACQLAYEQVINRSPDIRYIHDVLTQALDGYEVLYLPTYRRVELALTEDNPDRPGRKRKKPAISVAAESLHVGNIQFGLSDITDRLEELHRDVVLQSNTGYREISENIINELIKGYEVHDTAEIPTIEELKLFFSRLENTQDRRFGMLYPRISPPEYQRIYVDGGVPIENRRFLIYFLSKLTKIIRASEEIARPVEQFVTRCNKYLRSVEPSTHSPDVRRHHSLQSADAKEIVLDKSNLSVHVRSLPYNFEVVLDALSSGEKQMISLFAKLYLYPNKKIVLIDEPELSLSLDWQRDILVDVLMSPQCEQVLAITHSPFVFDNSLEPFARSIFLKVEHVSAERLNAAMRKSNRSSKRS